jgi:hypothetical protein
MLDSSEPAGGVVIYGADSGVSPSGSSSSNASRSACTSLVNDVQNGLATYFRIEGAEPDPLACCDGVNSVALFSEPFEEGAVPISPLRLSTRLSSFEMRFLSSLSTPRLPACRALCLRVLAVHVRFDRVHCPQGYVRSHLIFLR